MEIVKTDEKTEVVTLSKMEIALVKQSLEAAQLHSGSGLRAVAIAFMIGLFNKAESVELKFNRFTED